MSWVKEALEQLSSSGEAKVRPIGGSMLGRIESGQLVTLKEADVSSLKVDDAVFVRWKGNYLLHLIVEIEGGRILIGNNLGKRNGWIDDTDVLAIVVSVED